MSDKYGRKPILLFSVAGTVLGFFLLGVAKTLPLLFLARVIDGASAGNSSIARAAIADITTKDNRVAKLGIVFTAESLGLIFGPILGGFFSQYGFTVSAYIAGFIALLCFFLILFYFPETRDISLQPTDKNKWNDFNLNVVFQAFKNPNNRIFILIVFLVQFLITAMWGTLALYGKNLFGLTGKEIGYISSFAAMIGILSQTVLLKFLLRIVKEKTLVILGLFTMGIGLLLLAVSNIVAVLLIGVGLMAMCFNLLMPTVTGLASKLSLESEQGNLMGVISSVTYTGSLLGPVIANLIFSFSMRGNYLTASMIALIASLLSIKGIKILSESNSNN